MKKGINIWSFPAQSLKESFKMAKDAGFDGVELALFEEGELSLNTTEEELLAIKKSAEECGIELYSVASELLWYYWLNDTDETLREKGKAIVRKQIDCAKALGCDSILVVPGVVGADWAIPGKTMDYELTYERSLDALKELSKYAEEKGVCIAVENVGNKFLLSPMEMRDFVDAVGSDYVQAYFDVGNCLMEGYPEHWIHTLGKRIKQVHFKDYRVIAGGDHGFVDLLAGDVDYPAVMQAFKDIGYDGWVTAEMIPNYKYHTEAIVYNTSFSMDKILGRK